MTDPALTVMLCRHGLADGTQAARKTERRYSNASSQSTEDGEISQRDPGGSAYAYGRSPSPARRAPKAEKKEADLDAYPATCQEVNSARLSRWEIVDILHKNDFESVATGGSSWFHHNSEQTELMSFQVPLSA